MLDSSAGPVPTGSAADRAIVETGDAALARAIVKRDRKATAELVQAFAGPVYAYVQSRLAPRTELIEDLVQDVFVAAWQRMATYRGESTLRSWLLGIARHKVEDHFRESLRAFEEWDDGVDVVDMGSLTPDVQLDLDRRAENASRVLRELPERHRMILLWRYWEARSSKEIAELTGRSEKSVERLLARARENFRARWLNV